MMRLAQVFVKGRNPHCAGVDVLMLTVPRPHADGMNRITA